MLISVLSTPEKLMTWNGFSDFTKHLSLVVVDEAHVSLQWSVCLCVLVHIRDNEYCK